MRILFLYTELSIYFLNCVEKSKQNYGAQTLIISFPVNVEAPFNFERYESLQIIEYSQTSLKQLQQRINEFNPSIVYVSGWSFGPYMWLVRKFKRRIPIVLGLDNPWTNNLKYQLFSGLFGLAIRRLFTDVWIPGKPQLKLAQALGFSPENVHKGLYCADVQFYNSLFEENKSNKIQKFPKRFLFCARYIQEKNLDRLCRAFIELKEETENEWELWCVGTGEQFEKRIQYSGIIHFGFVQPYEMGDIINKTGVYILPSIFEPWAVSVHEFAAAGFPLLLSYEVGSSSIFLDDGVNGFLFDPFSIADIKDALKKIILLNEQELWNMCLSSNRKAFTLTPDDWYGTLLSIVDRNKRKEPERFTD
jgi:glycosyltransferase involved in cell wall biosynthesis